MYATLANSFEWNMLNKDGQVNNRIQEAITKGKQITPDMIPTVMNKLKNRIKSPIISQLTQELNEGGIIMVYCPTVRIPVYLPFSLISGNGGKVTGLVFLSNCDAQIPSEGAEMEMDERKLKVTLEACYMAKQFVGYRDSVKLQATSIVRPASKIYAYMMAECINRKHSIKLDADIFNTVIFILSRYFIGTVMGAKVSNDTMESYCLYNCTNPEVSAIRKAADQFTADDYKNISTVLQKMVSVPELKGRLGKLTVANFTDSYIIMYNAAMLLAMENFSYFMYNVMSVNEATRVNNYQILKNIFGQDGKKLYAAVLTTICGI